eukprot:4907425-Amphidinium_carterae.2
MRKLSMLAMPFQLRKVRLWSDQLLGLDPESLLSEVSIHLLSAGACSDLRGARRFLLTRKTTDGDLRQCQSSASQSREASCDVRLSDLHAAVSLPCCGSTHCNKLYTSADRSARS